MLGWSKSDIDHFRWMCINLSMTLDLDIIFNGESVYLEDDEEDGTRVLRFGKLYFPVEDDDHIQYFQMNTVL